MDYILPNRYHILPIVNDLNFAKIDFNWGNNKTDSSVFVNFIDYDNIIRTRMEIKYEDLVYSNDKVNTTDPKCYEKINSRFKSIEDYFYYYKKHYFQIMFLIPYFLAAYIIFNILLWICKKVILLAILLYTFIYSKILKRSPKPNKNN